MNKFRKWFFKFVFGCDLVEYLDLLGELHKTTHTYQKSLEESIEILESKGRLIELADNVNDRCKWLLERCEELEKK